MFNRIWIGNDQFLTGRQIFLTYFNFWWNPLMFPSYQASMDEDNRNSDAGPRLSFWGGRVLVLRIFDDRPSHRRVWKISKYRRGGRWTDGRNSSVEACYIWFRNLRHNFHSEQRLNLKMWRDFKWLETSSFSDHKNIRTRSKKLISISNWAPLRKQVKNVSLSNNVRMYHLSILLIGINPYFS